MGHVPGGHPPASVADQRSGADETALFLDACCGQLDELARLLAGARTHIAALQSENGRLKSELASCRWVEHSAAAGGGGGGGGGGGAAAAQAPAAAPLHYARAAGERKTAVSASAGVIVLDSDEEEAAAVGGERHAISDESRENPVDGAVQRGGHGAAPENPQEQGAGAATAATAGKHPQKSLYSD